MPLKGVNDEPKRYLIEQTKKDKAELRKKRSKHKKIINKNKKDKRVKKEIGK